MTAPPIPPIGVSLPWSSDAEKTVLGGILIDPQRAFPLVADQLTAEDFYHPGHLAIFAAMAALDASGKPLDPITVWEQMTLLDTATKLRAQGGETYFAELTGAVVTIENIGFHARMVADKARMRRTVEAAQQIAAEGMSGNAEAGEYLDAAQRAIFAATSGRERAGYERAQKILGRTIKAIEARYDNKQAITGVASGFAKLDEMLAGFQPSDLVIIAARPSMGKTALVMNAVAHASIDLQVPALVFSLEMSKEALLERLLSADAGIDSGRIRSGMLGQNDWIGLTKSGVRVHGSKLDIDDGASPSLMTIRARARRWRSENPDGLGVIAIDYLQLVDLQREKGQSTADAVGAISRGLKGLAKELRVPVIALSQLNRAVEERADKRPTMSDLRDSGAIEQDADVIAFIYRDEVYHTGKECKAGCFRCQNNPGQAELIVAKQRNGPIGTVGLRFVKEFTRFENPTSQA